MPKTALEEAQDLIRNLSAEDRQNLIPFLASLPDSGLESYDLTEELKVIENAGQLNKSDDDPKALDVLFQLVVPVRNVVIIKMGGLDVLHVVFRPEGFRVGFPVSRPNLYQIVEDGLREDLFTEEKKVTLRAKRKAEGVEETDAEFEQAITSAVTDSARVIVNEKAKRVAVAISKHLPRMVGDMFDAAIQGQTFADLNKLAESLGQPDKRYSASKMRRMLTERYWNDVKRHLGVTQGGARNVKHVWNDTERECLANQYTELRALWIEAKRIAKTAQRSPERTRRKGWKKEVLAVYEGLPEDLLERYTTTKADDAKPSTIAIIHAARLCLPDVDLSPARLLEEVKAWKNKTTS